MIERGGRVVAERLMRALMVVEMEVAVQRAPQLVTVGEVAGVDQFVLQRSPQPFDEDVVESPSAAVHADADLAAEQCAGEVVRGELRALIGVENLGLTEAERGVQRRQAEAGFQGVRQLPTEYVAAEPVHHGDEVEEAATHWNVSNIGAPDLVGPHDGHVAQQVRVDAVARRRTAQPRLRIERLDAQDAHQPLRALAVDPEFDGHAAAAEKRALYVHFVEPTQQRERRGVGRARPPVVARARQAEQLALPAQAQHGMRGIDPSALIPARRNQLFF